MQLVADIIQQVLDCFSNPEDVRHLTIIQGMSPGEWWVHTNSDVYMHVHWLRGYGLIASTHEYVDMNVESFGREGVDWFDEEDITANYPLIQLQEDR